MTQPESAAEQVQSTPPRFDQYVRYEDDDATIICDRRNAAAWIRSARVVPVRR